MSLNPRQKRFARAYWLSGNATQAYREVYGTTDHSAEAAASRLLRKVEVREAVEKLREGAEIQCELSKEEMLSRLCEIIDAKPDDASADNPLCELVMTKMGPESLFPSKMAAMTLLARLCGWEKPQKHEHGLTDELSEILQSVTGARES